MIVCVWAGLEMDYRVSAFFLSFIIESTLTNATGGYDIDKNIIDSSNGNDKYIGYNCSNY